MRILKSVPALALIAFVATRLVILFGYEAYLSDVRLYYQIAMVVIDKGGLPYRDVLFGYPPLSLSTIYLPYFFSQNYDTYRLLYQLTNVAFDFVCFVYIGKFLAKRLLLSPKRVGSALIVYSLLGLFHGHYIYDRVDIFIVMCFAISLYYATAEKKPKLMMALTWGIIGTLWKLIPIFWMPVLVLLKARREGLKGLVTGTLYSLVPSFLILWAYNYWNDGILLPGLTLHSDRGIQVESLWATPFMLWRAFDSSAGVDVIFTHGASHLTGSELPDLYVQFSKYLGFSLLAAFYLFVVRILFVKLKRNVDFERNAQAPMVFFMMSPPLLLFLISQRVLSTTFIIWLIPIFTILWAMERKKVALILAFGISALTYIGFDMGYHSYINFDVFYGAIYLLRNILLAGYTLYFAKAFHDFFEKLPQPDLGKPVANPAR